MSDISKLKINENTYDIKDSTARTNIETLENSLSTVATTGDYDDLIDKPTIPDVSNFITKDVNNLTYYTLTSNLSTVATTGDYDDLIDKPTIPTKTSDLTNDSNFATTSYVDNAVKDVYSTTEQLIGTYKGSNLYRKIIDIDTTSISSSSTTAKSLLNENINIVNYSGIIVFATSNYTYSINGYRTLDYGLRYDRTNHALQIIVGTSLAPEGSFSGQVIIEYTKN